MTQNDDILQLLKMTECPERYDDRDIEQVMAGSDFVWLSRIAGAFAMAAPATMSAEAAWEKLTPPLRPVSSPRRRWSVAAAIIGFVLLSGIAFAAFKMGLFHPSSENEAAETPGTEIIESETVPTSVTNEGAKTIIFENEPLEQILHTMADRYHVTVSFREEDIKSLRLYYEWDESQPLDAVVNDLNHFNRFQLTVEQQNIIVE